MRQDILHDRLQGEDFSNLTLLESRLLSTPWNLNPHRPLTSNLNSRSHASSISPINQDGPIQRDTERRIASDMGKRRLGKLTRE